MAGDCLVLFTGHYELAELALSFRSPNMHLFIPDPSPDTRISKRANMLVSQALPITHVQPLGELSARLRRFFPQQRRKRGSFRQLITDCFCPSVPARCRSSHQRSSADNYEEPIDCRSMEGFGSALRIIALPRARKPSRHCHRRKSVHRPFATAGGTRSALARIAFWHQHGI